MTTAARSSQQTKYRSQTVFPRLLSIPANQMPFSHATAPGQTVRPTTTPALDCASGDSSHAKLTPRRQEWGKTGPLLSPTVESGPQAVADRRVCLLPPARLTSLRQPARQTVHLATAPGPNCASGDNERPFFASGCHRRHSLARTLSPDAQFAAGHRMPGQGIPSCPAPREREASRCASRCQRETPPTKAPARSFLWQKNRGKCARHYRLLPASIERRYTSA